MALRYGAARDDSVGTVEEIRPMGTSEIQKTVIAPAMGRGEGTR